MSKSSKSSGSPLPSLVSSSPGVPANFVSVEHYLALLDELAEAAKVLDPLPDCVIGMKRSGLFPAVYLSHKLHLPMLVDSETKHFPADKFKLPLIVDTTCWNGRSLRVIYNRLVKAGVGDVRSLVMFARRDPQPNIAGLMYLQQAVNIPSFWYSDSRGGGE